MSCIKGNSEPGTAAALKGAVNFGGTGAEMMAVSSRKDNGTCYPSLLPRIISGSIGSIVTALAVTPLEVVKVRQQTSSAPSGPPTTTPSSSLPRNVRPCPSCGTFVLNNGLMECVVARKSLPYLNAPKIATANRSGGGTLSVLRTIFVKEGFSGIYAGLAPTLVMSVPNTVLYFTAYDELVTRLRSRYANGSTSAYWIPLVSGSTARLLASGVTAPLELIRTRQAMMTSAAPSLWGDLRKIVRQEGFLSLYRGLAPTLWRDVPFSAIYWFSLEQFKARWRHNQEPGAVIGPLQQAGQAFLNGAAAGMIAAAFTTPFDVVKTRQQVAKSSTLSSSQQATEQASQRVVQVQHCHHNGAVVYQPSPFVTNNGTLGMMRRIVEEEGLAGLWRGNATRMIKVAPACAIMISCYELGKLLLETND